MSKKKQVHVHGDLRHAGKRGDELKVVAAAATQKVTAGVFQQVRLLHLLIDDSVQNSKISAISDA